MQRNVERRRQRFNAFFITHTPTHITYTERDIERKIKREKEEEREEEREGDTSNEIPEIWPMDQKIPLKKKADHMKNWNCSTKKRLKLCYVYATISSISILARKKRMEALLLHIGIVGVDVDLQICMK